MRYGSVCSGIEAASVAWHPLGWDPAFFSEIEPYPCAALSHHYPSVPNFGDMNNFKDWPDANIDLLVGGTPCQSFSVAGLRKGLADPRGNLALTYLAIAERYRPKWVVWENVPGVLSADSGRAFGSFLGALGELGYGWAYRVLDAQYFGLAQRRKRVFVVGSTRGWAYSAAVLFERESLYGHPAPRREARERVAASLTSGSHPGSNAPGRRREDDTNIVAGTLGASHSNVRADHAWTNRLVAHALRGEGFDASEDGTGRGIPLTAMCLNAGGMGRQDSETETLIPFDTTQVTSKANRSSPQPGDPCHPIAASAHAPAIAGTAVRRLTPRECERLQGFPDDYTLIPYRGKPAADGPRYKALGNSMAVPCMYWIGRRIELVQNISSPPPNPTACGES